MQSHTFCFQRAARRDVTAMDSMETAAKEVMGIADKTYVQATIDRKVRAFFGAPIVVLADIWQRIQPLDRKAAKEKHLLWACVFLHVYSTEEIHCRIVGGADPKTFREWSWYMLEKVAGLKETVILLDNRFDKWDQTNTCLMSIDGTDCPVQEPWPFDSRWYSEKMNGPGVKYEVGVCIATGFIVWINGPFPASHNDSTIFKNTLKVLLADDEGVEVDSGYKGDEKFKTPTVAKSSGERKMKSVVRGRHENVNSALKVFNVLNLPFHHNNPRDQMMRKFGLCFDSIAVITQLKFQHCGINYEVSYRVSYE